MHRPRVSKRTGARNRRSNEPITVVSVGRQVFQAILKNIKKGLYSSISRLLARKLSLPELENRVSRIFNGNRGKHREIRDKISRYL